MESINCTTSQQRLAEEKCVLGADMTSGMVGHDGMAGTVVHCSGCGAVWTGRFCIFRLHIPLKC